MVKARLSREDAKEKGWLLDGYPRRTKADRGKKKYNGSIKYKTNLVQIKLKYEFLKMQKMKYPFA